MNTRGDERGLSATIYRAKFARSGQCDRTADNALGQQCGAVFALGLSTVVIHGNVTGRHLIYTRGDGVIIVDCESSAMDRDNEQYKQNNRLL